MAVHPSLKRQPVQVITRRDFEQLTGRVTHSMTFAWTLAATLNRAKTVTTRNWTDDYAARFDAGDRFWVMDKSRRRNGTPHGVIQLTAAPERFDPDAVDFDQLWIDEGFEFYWMNTLTYDLPVQIRDAVADQESFARQWREDYPNGWLIRFELLAWTMEAVDIFEPYTLGDAWSGRFAGGPPFIDMDGGA